MNDLKKIATELRGDASPDPNDEREVSSAWLRERMRQHADALDALAAQAGEPVAYMDAPANEEHFVWYCKIGSRGSWSLPKGADAPMRSAVHAAFKTLTGTDAEFCFSGWGHKLTENEMCVVENRVHPDPTLLYLAPPPAAPVSISDLAAILHYPDHWDTAAYPTPESAVREALFCTGCSECSPRRAAPVSMAALEKALDEMLVAEYQGATLENAGETSAAYQRRNALCAEVLRLASAGVRSES